MGAVARLLRLHAVDRLHPDEAEIALPLFRGAGLAGDHVAGAEGEAPYLALGDIHIPGARAGPLLAQEAVAVGGYLQEARGQHEALLLGHRLQDFIDKVFPLERPVLYAQLLGQFQQFFGGFGL
ncbi:hypothetical protein HRbin23_00360 [bacterium HR23]|nr:hypothetical protein HRbin23_00360 [bacterium HR23]